MSAEQIFVKFEFVYSLSQSNKCVRPSRRATHVSVVLSGTQNGSCGFVRLVIDWDGDSWAFGVRPPRLSPA